MRWVTKETSSLSKREMTIEAEEKSMICTASNRPDDLPNISAAVRMTALLFEHFEELHNYTKILKYTTPVPS